MVAVPALTPVITPELLMVATLVVLLVQVQVPSLVAVVNVVVLPIQTSAIPVMASIVGIG